MATGSGDRISALPDDILHLLLSRLPSDEEVRTCVLARRWRHLWKSTRAIRITNRPWTAEKLHNFVNHLLLLRGGTPADVCSLKCGHLRGENYISEHLREHISNRIYDQLSMFAELWIRHVLSMCQVRVLKVWIRSYRRLCLAHAPFASQFVRRLDLTDVYLMLINCTHLPLDLSSSGIEGSGHDFFQNIHLSRIYSPTLRCLVITKCHFHPEFRTCISAPRVTHLELSPSALAGLLLLKRCHCW
ncbi:hypothetical protein QOZ80_9AG0677060 [Eleusine coracana subsp. coracana]|nr:hypothetical protein QOZ80_9AG0677060 [Eleusine coracana subsp. coracana]